MRVRLDVTKRLVRGKKITVERGECKWVHFKYERLPNFCYRCGLLSHALKDCPDSGDCNEQIENMELQWGMDERRNHEKKFARTNKVWHRER